MATQKIIQNGIEPLKVAIVGASGYTGVELLRLLFRHPQVDVVHVTSEQNAGLPLNQVFYSLDCYSHLTFESFLVEQIAEDSSFVFLALPHKSAMDPAAALLKARCRVVDLSADYRFRDPSIYEKHYQVPHRYPWLLKDSIYGLSEIHREKIRGANLIGNPGCFPTGVLLGLYPLIRENVLNTETILIDAKSGVSGAGRTLSSTSHFVEVNEGMGPYQVEKHRHIPEMEQELSALAKQDISVSFVPHLIPMSRGILTTLFVNMNKSLKMKDLENIFQTTFEGEPFIKVLPEGTLSHTRHVRGSNMCEISFAPSRSSKQFIIFTAIDNLVKGASGQAIQNMNLMMGLEETMGLMDPGFYP